MNKGKIIVAISVTLMIIFYSWIIFYVLYSEDIEHTGTITMKWDIPKLVTTHYYFEIDNETNINVDSYDYHKYNIGDNYTWWE